ncbi:hypothetical protein M0R19_04055 [Candidatus Pacearchaeota archaeon]|nr:hypothetical protein [Candidatus Pacearchaeota archaeon]
MSNSSTTSFYIYGAFISCDEIENYIRNNNLEDEYDPDDPASFIETKEKEFNKIIQEEDHIEFYGDSYGEYCDPGIYIGMSPNELLDTETGGEFKARVKSVIKKCFKKEKKLLDKCEYGYYAEEVE